VKLIFTNHALRRITKRQLRRAWVENVVNSPERIEADKNDSELEHRLGIVPEFADRVLRVIVSKTEPKRVITVHLDRKMKDKL
jgi:uncharacterized DUF497 family protein